MQFEAWFYAHLPMQFGHVATHDHSHRVSKWAEICNRASNCIRLNHQIDHAFPIFLAYVGYEVNIYMYIVGVCVCVGGGGGL